jgi:hypothetical protein
MIKYITVLLATAGALAGLAACKKNEASLQQTAIKTPVITKLNRTFVQENDTLVIYGASLVQDHLTTEVFINGRPCTILRSTADSLQVRVPGQTRSGKVEVTISTQQQVVSAEGPGIEVKGTPLVKSFWPRYGYAGDIITLVVENFSASQADNRILLDGSPAQISGGNNHDTLLVTLPVAAHTGLFSWQTYQGPVQKLDAVFLVRQTTYPVTTVSGWLQADPAFRFRDTLMRGYEQLAGSNFETYKRIYDTALNYMNSSTRTYTIFIEADHYYYNEGMSLADFINAVKSKPYNYNSPMAAAIVPDVQLSLDAMHDGDLYNTAFTELLQWYPYFGSDDNRNKIQVTEEDGVKYANLLGIYGETNPRVKILREHRIGAVTIIEIDAPLGVILFQ